MNNSIVHSEPSEFKGYPAENCIICKKPSRTWVTPKFCLCEDCAASFTHVAIRSKYFGYCEKCGTKTHFLIEISDRCGYWCGCG